MNPLFLKRFLQRPFQVASITPSSKTLIRKVSEKMDFSVPRVIAEFGPGEGCHTREIVRKMHPDSTLLLFELDPELAGHLEEQFESNPRITVLNTDAAELGQELEKRNLTHCDYVVSGIPFSILEKEKKKQLLRRTYEVLAPEAHSAFIIYQVTNELVSHCRHFPRIESEYCLANLPPMFVTKFYKQANGKSVNGSNGHSNGSNGNGNGHH
jgi:phospholipid N-methyltransferase